MSNMFMLYNPRSNPTPPSSRRISIVHFEGHFQDKLLRVHVTLSLKFTRVRDSIIKIYNSQKKKPQTEATFSVLIDTKTT